MQEKENRIFFFAHCEFSLEVAVVPWGIRGERI